MRKETFEEITKRYNSESGVFIQTEALRVFYKTESEEIKLDALKLLWKAAQPR